MSNEPVICTIDKPFRRQVLVKPNLKKRGWSYKVSPHIKDLFSEDSKEDLKVPEEIT